MNSSYAGLADSVLLRCLSAQVARERGATAVVLALIAEVDARKLYLPAAHPSMFSYCVHELHLSEDSAYKRIQAARKAREYPAIFSALADGRIHLSAVGLLAPHLTAGNVAELLEASTHKTKAEIEQLVAARFPRSEMLPLVETMPASIPDSSDLLAPGQVEGHAREVDQLAPGQVGAVAIRARIAPIAAQRFALHLSLGQDAHDKLRYAQALLSHRVPTGDLAEVFERALEALIANLEKRKFAATRRPRRQAPETRSARHIPAQVKRVVWERDGGRCTFVSEGGQRCPACSMLEFDHINEVARGGRAAVDGIQLRCREHNQNTAECTFGSEFMSNKRSGARRARTERAALRQLGGSETAATQTGGG